MALIFSAPMIFTGAQALCQSIQTSLPKHPDVQGKWLFYLHGAIVQDQGVNAVSKDYGPYKYLDILDTLKSRGFNVISEVRPKATEPGDYAEKVSRQVDSLISAGVSPHNITVVGASAGASITMDVATKMNNAKMNYVIMGLCGPAVQNDYEGKKLCGHFLSIYERSDSRRSCDKIFQKQPCAQFKELELNTGKSHGFIYQPYNEWVDPLVDWINKKK